MFFVGTTNRTPRNEKCDLFKGTEGVVSNYFYKPTICQTIKFELIFKC